MNRNNSLGYSWTFSRIFGILRRRDPIERLRQAAQAAAKDGYYGDYIQAVVSIAVRHIAANPASEQCHVVLSQSMGDQC